MHIVIWKAELDSERLSSSFECSALAYVLNYAQGHFLLKKHGSDDIVL